MRNEPALTRLDFGLAKPSDAQAIADIRNAARLGSDSARRESTASSVRQQIRRGEPKRFTKLTLIVGCLDGTPICEAGVSTARPNFWLKRFWTEPEAVALGIFGITVHPAFQNRGAGKQLLRFIEACARDRDYDWVRLDAYKSNAASNAFYRSAGYEMRAEITLRGTDLVLYEKRTPSTDASQ